jgi:23S rRNA pseudouridine1911/1915/1917 synthase
MEAGDRELVVGPESAGERLDVFLAPAAGSRAAAQRLIDAGVVLVDGAAKPKRHVVAAGERVVFRPPPAVPEPERPVADFEVVYEDDHLLVVDKPAGVVVHPARQHRSGTLAQALAGRAAGGDDPSRAGIVHRLDRDTSGLLVVARTEEAHAALKAMLKDRRITREYLALVEGRPAARAGTIDAPLGRDRRVRTRISTDTDEPREAITHFETERALERYTLLRVQLDTGRTHQIRAHLKAIGHPVAGDPEYGRPGALGLDRQFLHAARLAFTHPVTGAAIDLRSPLPSDLEAALVGADADRSTGGRGREGRPADT